MWIFIFLLCISQAFCDPVLIPSAQFSLENGRLQELHQVTQKERFYTERILGCDISCSQICLGQSQGSALLECFKFCGCRDLISDLPSSLADYPLKSWDAARIDIDYPDGPGEGTRVDAYLPTGYSGQRERYTLITKPRASENESDYAYVDLPNTNSAEDISFEYSDKSGDGWEKSRLKWESLEPGFNGEYNHEQEERENYYEESHNFQLPNMKYEAGLKRNMEYNPDIEEVRFDDVIYDTDTVVSNVGKIKGEKGRFDVTGSVRWENRQEKEQEIRLIVTGCINKCFYRCEKADKPCFNRCISGCDVDKDDEFKEHQQGDKHEEHEHEEHEHEEHEHGEHEHADKHGEYEHGDKHGEYEHGDKHQEHEYGEHEHGEHEHGEHEHGDKHGEYEHGEHEHGEHEHGEHEHGHKHEEHEDGHKHEEHEEHEEHEHEEGKQDNEEPNHSQGGDKPEEPDNSSIEGKPSTTEPKGPESSREDPSSNSSDTVVSEDSSSESSSRVSVSTFLIQGFLITLIGGAIYRFMHPVNGRDPNSERLLTPYQRI